MYKTVEIANFFIHKGIESKEPISPIKLQKLLYFAYGWYYAIHNKKLFNENIEAWKFGPVINSIYHKTKKYGNAGIKTLIEEISDGFEIKTSTPIVPASDTVTISFLNDVWKVYGVFTPIQLANLSHDQKGPWYKIAASHDFILPLSQSIDDDSIKTYFNSLNTTSSTQTIP